MAAARLWYDVSDAVHADFGKVGIKIFDADPAPEPALVAASEPIVAAWKEHANAVGIDGEAALKFYKERLADLSE